MAKSNGSLPPGGWIIVTCGLTACTSGSAPGPTIGNEYGKSLLLPYRQLSNLLLTNAADLTARLSWIKWENLGVVGTPAVASFASVQRWWRVQHLLLQQRHQLKRPGSMSHRPLHQHFRRPWISGLLLLIYTFQFRSAFHDVRPSQPALRRRWFPKFITHTGR